MVNELTALVLSDNHITPTIPGEDIINRNPGRDGQGIYAYTLKIWKRYSIMKTVSENIDQKENAGY